MPSGENQRVEVTMKIPQDANFGEYFALLKAKPILDDSNEISILPSVAGKLSFEIDGGRSDVENFVLDVKAIAKKVLGFVVVNKVTLIAVALTILIFLIIGSFKKRKDNK